MDGLTAAEIVHVPLDAPFRAYFGNPYAVVHRADLHGVLLDACRANPLIELRTDHRVTGYEQDDSSVTVFVDGRDPIVGCSLIGADGLRSAVRQQLVGDGEPRVSGHTTYRSVIPTEQMPEDLRWNAATLWAGPKCHIVHYPLKGWKVFNLVVTYHNDVRSPRLAFWSTSTRCEKALSISRPRRGELSSKARTGCDGSYATAIQSKTGWTAALRYSAMQPIRCCSILPKAPAWRLKTPFASVMSSQIAVTRWRLPCKTTSITALHGPPAYK